MPVTYQLLIEQLLLEWRRMFAKTYCYHFEFDYKKANPLKFKDKLVLSNISFKYNSLDKYILKDINITIKKGERIGIIGKTGSGKSTLADIIMGLLKPIDGNLFVDGQKLYKRNQLQKLFQWRLAISHVPQNIFLSDNSIAENIAFGISQKDIDITVESFEDFVKAYRKDNRVILLPIGIILGFLALFYFLG